MTFLGAHVVTDRFLGAGLTLTFVRKECKVENAVLLHCI